MKLLIIEDDLDTRSYVKRRLEEKGCLVDEAGTGKQGLFFAKTGSYDAIILDYGLPEKNGLEVCRELRDANNHVPIIMISVMGEIPTKVESFARGADDYLTKPFFFDELYARLQAIIRRPKICRKPTVAVEDLVIDLNRQKVTRGSRSIYLTKKEFALLEYLARNSGDVVPRSVLIEYVWDADHDPFSNTIETHILNLRKKIDEGKKKKLIHSIPGRGYKLDKER